ncbi:hypothetical protein ACFBZI_08500 [Moraxella sp. ZJ142]|uniref:hypothetical protein n=1 Tax=Moraxella marmotae TaxID=3344520 RepID=UPI0035D4B3C8
MKYYNQATGQTAKINSDKADSHGNIWVEIDGGMPVKMSYDEFIKQFKAIVSERRTKI